MGCDAASLVEWFPTFRKIIVKQSTNNSTYLYYLTLKTKALRSAETSRNTRSEEGRCIPEEFSAKQLISTSHLVLRGLLSELGLFFHYCRFLCITSNV